MDEEDHCESDSKNQQEKRKKTGSFETLCNAAFSYVTGYFAETTVHGFHYVIEGKNKFEKLIWIFFIAMSIYFAGFQVFTQ